jgi:hypothetical protein
MMISWRRGREAKYKNICNILHVISTFLLFIKSFPFQSIHTVGDVDLASVQLLRKLANILYILKYECKTHKIKFYSIYILLSLCKYVSSNSPYPQISPH